MTESLVLGDGAVLPAELSGKKADLHLVTVGKNRNLRLQADVFRTQLWRDPSPRLADLLRLAAFVYGADTRISRGSTKDVFALDWSRSFRMILPVSDLSFWKQREVKEALGETLNFLTGDEFTFDFVQCPPLGRCRACCSSKTPSRNSRVSTSSSCFPAVSTRLLLSCTHSRKTGCLFW